MKNTYSKNGSLLIFLVVVIVLLSVACSHDLETGNQPPAINLSPVSDGLQLTLTGKIPNLDELFSLFEKSYSDVWTKENISKAKVLGYTIPELVTIASIVQSESHIKTEQQKIAGVYINRLKQDMKLQADPTIVFANGNFDVQRVLSVDKEIDSPYNTYRYKGLPPGPICLVNTSVIDAVLNYTKHNYTYFCANADFSGYSCFTNEYSIHQKNAKAYQTALNKRGIKR